MTFIGDILSVMLKAKNGDYEYCIEKLQDEREYHEFEDTLLEIKDVFF